MKHVALFVAALLWISAAPPVSADPFREGVEAHERGDYVEAARLFRRAAER